MNISEDELEQRLRELFADERLDLPPPPDAGTAIVAGARRRRRRRHGVLAVTGVAAAVVVVSGGLAMVSLRGEDGTAAMTAGGSSISVKPPENLTAGQQPAPPVPGPTGTQDIEASASPALPASRASRPPSTQPSSKVAPALSGPLLGSDGFGTLKLGMSETQIATQGVMLSDAQAGAGCTVYTARGTGLPSSAIVLVSKAVGLAVVTPQQAAHTAEGIGAGSTREQVLAAYPAAKEEAGGITAPVRAAAAYRFRLDDSGVVETSLVSVNQDCAG